jgi:hypothetical protein
VSLHELYDYSFDKTEIELKNTQRYSFDTHDRAEILAVQSSGESNEVVSANGTYTCRFIAMVRDWSQQWSRGTNGTTNGTTIN